MASSQTETWPSQARKAQTFEDLVAALSDSDPFARQQASEQFAGAAQRLQRRGRFSELGLSSPLENRDGLLRLLATEAERTSAQGRAAIAESLGQWHYTKASPVLLSLLSDEEAGVRVSAALALGESGDPLACEALHFTLGDQSLWVRKAAADALGRMGMSQSGTVLAIALAQEEQQLVRSSIISALGHIDTAAARNALTGALEEPDPTVRWCAVRSLTAVGTVGAIPLLESLIDDPEELFGHSIGEMAAKAIAAIEKRDSGPFKAMLKALYALRHRIAKLHKR